MSSNLATQVQRVPASEPSITPAPVALLQRQCACGGGAAGLSGQCEECNKKNLTVQRSASGGAESSVAPPIAQEALRSPGQSLDPSTRTFMESRFGHNFADVRVHANEEAASAAKSVNALAYTVGNEVVFGAGQYRPHTNEGRRLLAHELTHVVQQGGGAKSIQRQVDEEETAPAETPETEATGGVASGENEAKDPGSGGEETVESSTQDEDAATEQGPSEEETTGEGATPVQAKTVDGSPASHFSTRPTLSAGRPLSTHVRQRMERGFGYDFSAVRLHSDSHADRFVAGANAYAATHGTNVYARSHIALESQPWLLAHELAHVVQQGRASRLDGDVGPQFKADAPRVSDDSGLEREADAAADSVMGGERASVSASVIASAPRPQFAKICQHESTQFSDFPATYVKTVNVDLGSQEVKLEWDGPNASRGNTGPFSCSPGAGCCGLDCDDRTTSRSDGSRCTPKGSFKIHGYSCEMSSYPEAKNVSWFSRSGIALHYYPSVPSHPASHGCVRLGAVASRLIYDNSRRNVTDVNVSGTWSRGRRGFCWSC